MISSRNVQRSVAPEADRLRPFSRPAGRWRWPCNGDLEICILFPTTMRLPEPTLWSCFKELTRYLGCCRLARMAFTCLR